MSRGRRYVPRNYAPPATDDCPICGEILNGPLTKTRRGWVHKECFWREQQ